MAHIVRIDKPKNSTKGTHGWQVRAGGRRGYHSKLFSDNTFGSKGKALVAAEEYLRNYLKENPEMATKPRGPFRQQFGSGKEVQANNTSGVNGVYRTHAYHGWDKKKEHKAFYWAAFCSIGPKGQKRWTKRFYVDTHGETEAKRLAIEFRQGWEEAVKGGQRALDEFFDREFFDKQDSRFDDE